MKLLDEQRKLSSEHLVLDDKGKLKGLYNIDPMKRIQGRAKSEGAWNVIHDLVETYAMLHPNEINMLKIENQSMKADKKDKHGSSKDKSKRHLCSIPPGLMFLLEKVEPDLFGNKKKLHKFLRKFPIFQVCEKL